MDPTPPPERLPFDQAIVQALREPALVQLQQHPELRSIGIFLDYRGELNQAQGVLKALWLGEHGRVRTPDAIVGSLRACLNLLEQLFVEGMRAAEQINQQLQAAQAQLLAARQQLPEAAHVQKQETPPSGAGG